MINFANPAVVVTMIALSVVALRVLWSLTERLAPKPTADTTADPYVEEATRGYRDEHLKK